MMGRREFFSTLLSFPVLLLAGWKARAEARPSISSISAINPSDEWERCKDDPAYFLARYYRVRGVSQFEVMPWMRDAIDAYDNGKTIVKAPRQARKTSLEVGLMLHRMVFFNDISVVVVAPHHRMSIEIVQQFKKAYISLPLWMMKCSIVEWNRHSTVFANGNRLRTAVGDGLRGFAFSDVFVDEAAWLPKETFIPLSVHFRTCHRAFVASTPHGSDFAEMWEHALLGDSDFRPVDV